MTQPSQHTDHPGFQQVTTFDLDFYVDKLMRNNLQLFGFAQHRFTDEPDWGVHDGDTTAEFKLHSLNFLYSLTTKFVRTGDARLAQKAVTYAESWWRRHSTPDATHPSWGRHATALRGALFAYLSSAGFVTAPWIAEALTVHGTFLADDANHDGAWNHGLDQDIALLDLAAATSRRDWAETAVRRSGAAVGELVDEQGVTIEQATHYAQYTWERLGALEAAILRAGIDVPAELKRRDLIPEFLAAATQPDGYLAPIGDSKKQKSKPLPGTPLEYAASQGTEGLRPLHTAHVYRNGWVFLRSGWGEKRSFAEESLLTARFGPYRRIHGHRDHTALTWYADGRPLLVDAGFSGYGDLAMRRYEQLESAHNQVTVADAGPYLWQHGTELRASLRWLDTAGTTEVHALLLAGNPYEDITRLRAVLHIPELDVLLVRDRVIAPKPVTLEQRWLLGPSLTDAAISEDAQTVTSADDHGTFRVQQLLRVRRGDVTTGSVDPVAGWVADGGTKRLPAPALTFQQHGTDTGFLTLLTPRDDVAVRVMKGGRIRVTAGGRSVLTQYTPEDGFTPGALDGPASTRFDAPS